MRTEVILPKMGFTMEEGTIARWFKSPGEKVTKGEPLLEVLTDKANMEVEAPVSGTLLQILAEEGQTVPVTSVIAVIGEPGDELLSAGASPAAAAPVTAPAQNASSPAPTGPERKEPIRATPAARRLARELGMDLAHLTRSGPDGTVTEEDVRRHGGSVTGSPASRGDLRQRIAQNLLTTWTTVPMVTLMVEVDATAMVVHRQCLKSIGSPVTYTDLIVRAVALALRDLPVLNASWREDRVVRHDQVNIGLAVDTEQGLVVPVIKEADRKSLVELVKVRRDLVEKARSGRLTPDEMAGGTFTISNLGQEGIEFFTPIIRPPEGGVLGVGILKDRPVCRDGQLVAAPVLPLSLTFDHRLIDGAPAARFLRQIVAYLEAGESPVYAREA